jgi:hypothetical protein
VNDRNEQADTVRNGLGQPGALLAVLLAQPPASMLELALRWLALDTERACRIAAFSCATSRTPPDFTARKLEGTQAGNTAVAFLDWLRGGPASVEDTALRILILDIACTHTDPGTEPSQVLKAAIVLYAWFTGGRRRRGGAR